MKQDKTMNSHSSLNAFIIIIMLAAINCIQPAHAANYTIIDLGTLGGIDSHGADINSNGHVTGYSWTDDGIRAFLYDGNTLQDLGTPPDGVDSNGTGINDSGKVTGYSKIQGATSYFFNYRAFLHDGNSMQVPGVPAGAMDSFAYDINDQAQLTGRVTYSSADDPFIDTSHAFLYDGNSMQDLGTLGGRHSYGYGINDNGHITGWSDVSGDSASMTDDASVTHAFVYNGNSMQSIGTLGGTDSYGRDINDNGWVTGYSEVQPDDAKHAFVYNGNSMQDLGTLGGTNSNGHGINNSGHVVGYSQLADGAYAAFLYDGYSMLDLCVLTNCTENGWDSLYIATSINDRGDITGYGKVNGTDHAFLISTDDLPPPTDPEICDDDIDNDGDGLIDCDDSADCSQDPACSTPTPGPEICDDGIDNDGDGLTDCLDKKECRQDPACKTTSGGGGGNSGGGKNR
jgi:probable HAF family extracellular repeat protein